MQEGTADGRASWESKIRSKERGEREREQRTSGESSVWSETG